MHKHLNTETPHRGIYKGNEMAIFTTTEMVDRLKAMGLGQHDRRKVLETFRDAGEKEALEQANEIVARSKTQIAEAKQAAHDLFGINIGN
jgi:hypothetical protein